MGEGSSYTFRHRLDAGSSFNVVPTRGVASPFWHCVEWMLMTRLVSMLYQYQSCSNSTGNVVPLPSVELLALYEKCSSNFHLHGLLGGHWAAMCPWFHGAVPIKLICPSIEHITLSTPPSPQSPGHPTPAPWYITHNCLAHYPETNSLIGNICIEFSSAQLRLLRWPLTYILTFTYLHGIAPLTNCLLWVL